jgi:hypothetical protein
MEEKSRLDKFDLAFGSLEGRPGVTMTRPTTVVSTLPIVGTAQTFIIQTARSKDEGNEKAQPQFTTFVQYVDADGNTRLVMPPAVTEVMARQREALAGRARVKAARTAAATRKERGIVPAFLKGKKKR